MLKRSSVLTDLVVSSCLQACVKEVLRLYPAIPVFPREAMADDTLPSGHPISRGRAAGAAGHLTLLQAPGTAHRCVTTALPATDLSSTRKHRTQMRPSIL